MVEPCTYAIDLGERPHTGDLCREIEHTDVSDGHDVGEITV
jgi:hypothetical protein